MKKKTREQFVCEGSMTVEITLIMPILIGILLFLIFSLYYLHDVCAMEKGCSVALLRASIEREDAEAYRKSQEAMQDIRLLSKWDRSENILVEKDTVRISVDSAMPVSEGLFRKLLQGVYRISFQRTARRVDGVADIRAKRR